MKRISKTIEDFAWVHWNADHIKRVTSDVLAKKKEAYTQVKAVPATERTFENTIFAIENAGNLMISLNFIDLLFHASPDDSVRKAAEEAVKVIQKESLDMEYDDDLFRAFKEYRDKNIPLEGEDARLFKDMTRGFRRMGFDLPPEERERVKQNFRKMQELGLEFSSNLNKYQDHILATREELDGLPEGYIEGLKREGDFYMVSLQYPEFGPFMENATNAQKREELAHKNNRKGGERNLAIAKELRELRKKNSIMLGYETFTDYATEPRMAKNRSIVENFLSHLIEKIQLLADRDREELAAAKREYCNNSQAALEYYDTAFYSKLLEKQRFNFDSEKNREYFQLDRILGYMFEVYGKLFSITFKKRADLPVWHPDVSWYEVLNADGTLVGYTFFDLFPRENKYNHFACFNLESGYTPKINGEEMISPIAGIVGNFNKPTAERPALIAHNELVTMFHEFGHVLHGLFSDTLYSSLSTPAWDFIEVPSQLMEYWVWQPEAIKEMSEHYQTKEKLSDEIIAQMIKAKNHMIGRSLMFGGVLGWFDIVMHGAEYPEDPSAYYRSLISKHMKVELPDDILFPASFGHFVGYAGAYYSYLWSEVICADLFTRFKKEGLLNPAIGTEYRKKILEPAGKRDEAEIVKEFLGRDFTNDAYLEEMGLNK